MSFTRFRSPTSNASIMPQYIRSRSVSFHIVATHNSLSDHSTPCTWSDLPKVPLNIFKIHIQSVRMIGVYKDKIISRNLSNIETASLPHYIGKHWYVLCVISGFRREADKICTLLDCYVASSGNSFPTFRDNLTVLSLSVTDCLLGFLTLEDGTDRLSRNVGKELPILAA